jgi:serine/threonine protein kinase
MLSVHEGAFEERESKPKRLRAIVEADDGSRRTITMTIFMNSEAEQYARPCVENRIYALKTTRRRKQALRDLFVMTLDFSKLPLLDDTVTRVLLRTRTGTESPDTDAWGHRVLDPFLHPLEPHLGIDLSDLDCFIKKDEDVTIPFLPLDKYSQHSATLQFVPIQIVFGREDKSNRLYNGVYKVSVRNQQYVYKEVTSPDGIPSQSNEIEALVRLSKSSRIIALHGLVFSANSDQTYPEHKPPFVVRGILLTYAAKGDLHTLLTNHDIQIPSRQRLFWALEIAYGVQDIHNAGLAHGDLKSRNVVIGSNDDLHIIDLARTSSTYGWAAPELWFAEVDGNPLETFSVEELQVADIYSLGVVLWELGTGKSVSIPMDMEHLDFFTSSMAGLSQRYRCLVQSCIQQVPTS